LELDEEREELAKYQRLDKKRRSVEFTLHSNELCEILKEIDQVVFQSASKVQGIDGLFQLEEKEREASNRAGEVNDDYENLRSRIKKLEIECTCLVERKEVEWTKRSEVASLKARYIRQGPFSLPVMLCRRDLARVELDVKELESKMEGADSEQRQDIQELAVVESKIREQSERLQQVSSTAGCKFTKRQAVVEWRVE